MIKHKPTVAVVIPAHNEEKHIKSCLDSLMSQTVPVDEIIVVSNASTDNTATIAEQFTNVTVINIAEKGITKARNIGFNKANCEIIARLNADVVCPPNWNERLLKVFSNQDVWAVAGVAKTMLIPIWPYLYTSFWSRIYLIMAEAYFAVPILWGANMAIKKSTWDEVKENICLNDADVHEDQDISLHIAIAGGKIARDYRLTVSTSEKSYFSWAKFKQYNQLRKKTKLSHKSLINSPNVKRINILRRLWKIIYAGIPSTIFTIASFGVMLTQHLKHYLIDKHH